MRKLRVVADTANGMGGLVVPAVFERLADFELEVMYGELDGTFPNHPADPLQTAKQRDLMARVIAGGFDVGLAFDGDAVLFSDEAEQVFQSEGLVAFVDHESKKAAIPLPPGPFKPLLEALHRLQRTTSEKGMRIRTALVTARSAPAHERAIRTLMAWGVDVDEAMFLGGLSKSEFLREFEPDFFFDDQTGHCQSAASVAPTGHVVSGVSNKPKN